MLDNDWLVIGIKSAVSIFYHTSKDINSNINLLAALYEKSYITTNDSSFEVCLGFFCFVLACFCLDENFGTIIRPFSVNKKGWTGLT